MRLPLGGLRGCPLPASLPARRRLGGRRERCPDAELRRRARPRSATRPTAPPAPTSSSPRPGSRRSTAAPATTRSSPAPVAATGLLCQRPAPRSRQPDLRRRRRRRHRLRRARQRHPARRRRQRPALRRHRRRRARRRRRQRPASPAASAPTRSTAQAGDDYVRGDAHHRPHLRQRRRLRHAQLRDRRDAGLRRRRRPDRRRRTSRRPDGERGVCLKLAAGGNNADRRGPSARGRHRRSPARRLRADHRHALLRLHRRQRSGRRRSTAAAAPT